MSTSKFLPYIIGLVVGLPIGFFSGKAFSGNKAEGVVSQKQAPVSQSVAGGPAGNPEATPTSSGASAPVSAEAGVVSAPSEPAKSEVPSANVEAPVAKPANPVELPTAKACFTGDEAVRTDLTRFAEKIEHDSLWYSHSLGQDCSGIFLKVAAYCKSRCDRYQYPDGSTRDTRSLARWFYDRNNLVILQSNDDVVAKRNLIKPGAVMFFGYAGKSYNSLKVEDLKTSIQHIGVVTEVKTDDKGDVTGYVLFHGRTTGKIASRTHYHDVKPARLGMPPLGNWNQQLVAVAYVFTEKG